MTFHVNSNSAAGDFCITPYKILVGKVASYLNNVKLDCDGF